MREFIYFLKIKNLMVKNLMIKNKLKDIDLYFITDSTLSKKNNIEDIKAAIKGGVKIIQYREKNLPKEKIIEEAKKIKEICKENDVLFLINDFVDIALEVDADGIHLGLEDMSYEKARELLSIIMGQLKFKSLLAPFILNVEKKALEKYFLYSFLERMYHIERPIITLYWIIVAIAEPASPILAKPNFPSFRAEHFFGSSSFAW